MRVAERNKGQREGWSEEREREYLEGTFPSEEALC